MTDGPHERRRGVTRGYVGGLIAAVTFVAVALVVAGWGGIAYFSGRQPVESAGVWVFAAELVVGIALVLLVWGLWLQALALLRGRREPPWAHLLVIALGGYFIWSLGGMLFGLSIDETWLSPFAAVIALAWGLCSILFWVVLVRRVYTDRPTPQWPWERRELRERGEDGLDGPGESGGPTPPGGDR